MFSYIRHQVSPSVPHILCFITWLASVRPGLVHFFTGSFRSHTPKGLYRWSASQLVFGISCLSSVLSFAIYIFRGICSLALIYPDTKRASREIYHHFLYIHISSHQSLTPSISDLSFVPHSFSIPCIFYGI